jgi:putative membrane protein
LAAQSPPTAAKNLDRLERKAAPAIRQNTAQHLANERTYLAYIRTAVALITLGITINRFTIFLVQSHLVSLNDRIYWSFANVENAGIGMVIFGITVVIWAALNFERVKRQIDRGDFRPDLRIIVTIAIVIVGLAGLGLFWLFQR